MLTLVWSPAARAQTCVGGNLSTIVNTACSIGSLDITFGGLNVENDSFNNVTSTETDGPAYTASDFIFTPISNGFTLTFDGGPQSITAPASGYGLDYFQLLITSIVDSDGTITGESATGGTLTATGSIRTGESLSDIDGDICSPLFG